MTEAEMLRDDPRAFDGPPENKVLRSDVHRDRINRMRGLIARSRKGVVMKWTLVDPQEPSTVGAEMHVWGRRLAADGVWSDRGSKCPVCHGRVEWQHDTVNGTLLESESRCTTCPLWHSGVSFGYGEEQVGFCWFDWRYDKDNRVNESESRPAGAEYAPAVVEIQEALRDPEFRSLIWSPEGTPLGIVADWLGDHGYPLQEAGCRLFPITAFLKPATGKGSTGFTLRQ